MIRRLRPDRAPARPVWGRAGLAGLVLLGLPACSALPDWAVPGVLREDAAAAPAPFPRLVDIPPAPPALVGLDAARTLEAELEAARRASEAEALDPVFGERPSPYAGAVAAPTR